MNASLEITQFQRARSVLEVKVRQGTAKRDAARHLTEDLLQFDLPIAARYKRLDVIRILQDNCQGENAGLQGLIHGLGILERYGKNLLRSERPPLWRIIRLSNPVFKVEVDTIKGAREILKQLGYSKFVEDGMAFPEESLIPDIPNVAMVTADILLLRQELLMLASKEHRQEKDFYSYIRRDEILALQEDFGLRAAAKAAKQAASPAPPSGTPTSMIDNMSHMSSHPMVSPPSYEAVLRGAGETLSTGNAVPQPSSYTAQPMDVQNSHLVTSVEAAAVEIQEEELCDLCGQSQATCHCCKCDQNFCESCSQLYHSNPKRKNHQSSIVPLPRRDVPEATNQPINLGQNVQPTLLNNYNPLQERGSPGSHGIQPTISGERLAPTLTSRPSMNDHDNEWTRKVNRMATNLMDINDPEAKIRKLMECLAELDREGQKYKNGIDALRTKPEKKTSLVSHFQEKLTKIEDTKDQLKLLCGYVDPVPSPAPTLPSLGEAIPSTGSGSWTFGSVGSQSNPSVIMGNREMTLPHQVSMPHPPPQVASVPNLIDLTAETVANPSTMHLSHPSPRSAVEDPELQSVFTQPTMSNEATSHSNLKRSLEIAPTEVTQPAKIQRESQGSTEIASEFENMNIEPQTQKGDEMQMQPSEFTEPISGDSDPEEFQSAEGGEFEEPESDLFQNRLEEPMPKIMPPLLGISPEMLQDRMKKEAIRYQTSQFLDLIRAGDAVSFRPEQVETAMHELELEGNSNKYTPIAWLERNWENHIKSFIAFVKERNMKIPKENAEDVLLEGEHSFETALELLKKVLREQFADMAEKYGEEIAKKAMTQAKGNKYNAWGLLQKPHVKSLFDEFDASPEEADDVKKLDRAFQMNDGEKKYQAFSGFLDFQSIRPSQTLTAMFTILPEEMCGMQLEYFTEAVSNDELIDAQAALHYLDNECMICTEKFPHSRVTCLPTCGDNGCMYCRSCLEQYLKICIRDKNIRDIVCPVCSQPETNSDEETLTNFFNHIDAILRQINDVRCHEIFQQKVRDFTLMRLPNFRWCSHCSGGFQFDVVEGNLKMTCPFCTKCTCYNCKKPWESQHDNATCEEFQQWKELNDPEFQAAGLARHLKENGIDCPDCKFRYALAKGGCMHFKCTQCSHEFCSGCNSAFKHGRKCGKLPSCQNKGLHAHHPRDCLFFLRDSDPDMLRKLLKDNSIQYNTKGPNHKTCQVMEQKDTPTGLKDDACGRAVVPNCAGLCKLHYMEYLVNLVNTHGLDPADVFSIDELRPCLMREDIEVPQRKPRERDEDYRKRLLAEVKKLPLKREAHNQDVRMAEENHF